MEYNPIHQRIDKLEKIAGFAMQNGAPNELLPVLTSGFFHSDQKEFYLYIDQLSGIYLKDIYLVDGIHKFLVLIHGDLSADIYINSFPIELIILGTRVWRHFLPLLDVARL